MIKDAIDDGNVLGFLVEYYEGQKDIDLEAESRIKEIAQFILNPQQRSNRQMREDVETYEEAVRKQAALAEQARLKEQAAKEQESKAKSIKDKQEQTKDNPNKKSKP